MDCWLALSSLGAQISWLYLKCFLQQRNWTRFFYLFFFHCAHVHTGSEYTHGNTLWEQVTEPVKNELHFHAMKATLPTKRVTKTYREGGVYHIFQVQTVCQEKIIVLSYQKYPNKLFPQSVSGSHQMLFFPSDHKIIRQGVAVFSVAVEKTVNYREEKKKKV